MPNRRMDEYVPGKKKEGSDSGSAEKQRNSEKEPEKKASIADVIAKYCLSKEEKKAIKEARRIHKPVQLATLQKADPKGDYNVGRLKLQKSVDIGKPPRSYEGLVNPKAFSHRKKRTRAWYLDMSKYAERILKYPGGIKLEFPSKKGYLNSDTLQIIEKIADLADLPNDPKNDKQFDKDAKNFLADLGENEVYGSEGAFQIITAFERGLESLQGQTFDELPELTLKMKKGYEHQSHGKPKDLSKALEDWDKGGYDDFMKSNKTDLKP